MTNLTDAEKLQEIARWVAEAIQFRRTEQAANNGHDDYSNGAVYELIAMQTKLRALGIEVKE